MASSSTATANPPLSRSARRMRKSPMAAGTRMPAAIVAASSHGAARSARLLEGPDDRGAAGRLHRHHARAGGADPAQRLELGQRLPYADQAGAAAGGIEDRVGHAPPQLLRQLDAHRLLALDAVGLLEGRAVEPAARAGAAGDDRAAVGDGAVDPIEPGAAQADLADHGRRRVVGTEHHRLDAGAAAVGGERGAGVAVGRHGHAGDAELARHRHRERQAARLERAGGQASLVLDQDRPRCEVAHQGARFDQRRLGFAQGHDAGGPAHRQQLAIAP